MMEGCVVLGDVAPISSQPTKNEAFQLPGNMMWYVVREVEALRIYKYVSTATSAITVY